MKKSKALGYLFILPAVLGMLFVHIMPMGWGILISFRDLTIRTIRDWTSAPFVGIQNFINALNPVTTIGQRYLQSLYNIFFFGVMTISIGFVIALVVALILNKPFKCKTLIRGLFLVPYITPDSVAFNFWRFIFQRRIGIFNEMLLRIGIIREPITWLVGRNTMWAVIIASIWKGWPLTALILLAGLQTIPGEIYEAAKIDGASAWQQFKYITIPYLKPIIKTVMIMNILWNFHAYNQFRVMFGADPGRYAEVPNTLIMREAFEHYRYGQGAALSVLLMLIMLTIVLIYLIFFRNKTEE
ncbi:carbohydrate ABC transporter permease [Natronospora cellulosivora (SeqCode)]